MEILINCYFEIIPSFPSRIFGYFKVNRDSSAHSDPIAYREITNANLNLYDWLTLRLLSESLPDWSTLLVDRQSSVFKVHLSRKQDLSGSSTGTLNVWLISLQSPSLFTTRLHPTVDSQWVGEVPFWLCCWNALRIWYDRLHPLLFIDCDFRFSLSVTNTAQIVYGMDNWWTTSGHTNDHRYELRIRFKQSHELWSAHFIIF